MSVSFGTRYGHECVCSNSGRIVVLGGCAGTLCYRTSVLISDDRGISWKKSSNLDKNASVVGATWCAERNTCIVIAVAVQRAESDLDSGSEEWTDATSESSSEEGADAASESSSGEGADAASESGDGRTNILVYESTDENCSEWKLICDNACAPSHSLIGFAARRGGIEAFLVCSSGNVWASVDGCRKWSLVGESVLPCHYGAGYVACTSGDILMLGGMNWKREEVCVSYISADGGRTWDAERCPWTPRRRATCVETAGGKVILMSGKSSAENPDDDVILTDAWASSDSGRTWVCLSKYMSFGVMYNIGFAAVLHGRAILIVGGHSYGDVFEFEEDVWETDGDKSSQRALASASAVS